MAELEKEKQEAQVEEAAEAAVETAEVNPWEEKFNEEHNLRLRLAAEYDNFRKRTAKEKEQSYTNGKSDAVAKLLNDYFKQLGYPGSQISFHIFEYSSYYEEGEHF